MVANPAAANFVAVGDHVVLVCQDFELVFGGFQRMCATLWHTERVVTKVHFARLVIHFVKRKVDNPAQCDNIRVFEVEVRGKLVAESSQNFIYV